MGRRYCGSINWWGRFIHGETKDIRVGDEGEGQSVVRYVEGWYPVATLPML